MNLSGEVAAGDQGNGEERKNEEKDRKFLRIILVGHVDLRSLGVRFVTPVATIRPFEFQEDGIRRKDSIGPYCVKTTIYALIALKGLKGTFDRLGASFVKFQSSEGWPPSERGDGE